MIDDCFKREKSFPVKLLVKLLEIAVGRMAFLGLLPAASKLLSMAPSMEDLGETIAMEADLGRKL